MHARDFDTLYLVIGRRMEQSYVKVIARACKPRKFRFELRHFVQQRTALRGELILLARTLTTIVSTRAAHRGVRRGRT